MIDGLKPYPVLDMRDAAARLPDEVEEAEQLAEIEFEGDTDGADVDDDGVAEEVGA